MYETSVLRTFKNCSYSSYTTHQYTTHHTPLIIHHSSYTTHHTPLIIHHSSYTTHHTPLIIHHSSNTTHHTPLIIHHSSYTTHHTPLIIQLAPVSRVQLALVSIALAPVYVAGAALCEPPCADFVAGTALCEPPCAEFVAGTALCEPPCADFVAGTALCQPPCADFVAGAAFSRDSGRTKRCVYRKGGSEAGQSSFAERRVRDGLGSFSDGRNRPSIVIRVFTCFLKCRFRGRHSTL